MTHRVFSQEASNVTAIRIIDKKLRSLWSGIRKEAIQRSVGVQEQLSSEKVLLAYLCKLEAFGVEHIRLSISSAKTNRQSMRSVRVDEKPSRTSCRRKCQEQCKEQYSDSLQALSSLVASYARKAWVAYRGENAVDLVGTGLDGFAGVASIADSVPHRVDRLTCLGNSVLPQLAQWIGQRVIAELDRRS